MRSLIYMLCLVLLLVVVPYSWAAWTENITVTDMEGRCRVLTFGEHSEALAGFDHMDIPIPPLPPTYQSLDAVFVVSGLFSRLTKDIKQEGVNNQWTLEVRSGVEDIRLTWDTDSIPSDRAISLVWSGGGTTIDMRTRNSLVLPGGRHSLSLQTAMQQVSYTVNPVTNDDPPVTNNNPTITNNNPTTNDSPVIRGDVNGDGLVDQCDAMLVSQMLVSLWQFNSSSGNAENNLSDAEILLLHLYGLAAPGRSRNDGNAAVDPDPPVSPSGKYTTTWAAIKAY